MASDASLSPLFGYATAIDGDRLVVGARGEPTNEKTAGAAYLFDLGRGNVGAFSFCEPTTAGSFGTAQATFNLTDVPDSFGILFAGDSATNVLLGCGSRCVNRRPSR